MNKPLVLGIIMGIALIAAASVAGQFDLKQYPMPFIVNEKFYGVIVIGDNAAASDTIGAIDIAISMQYLTKNKLQAPVVLASEIDSVMDQNTIVVGGPCANPAAAELLGYPNDCMEGFWGRSVVQLFENNGNVQILAAGGSSTDTRRAARILARYEQNKNILNGTYVEVRNVQETGMSFNVGLTE